MITAALILSWSVVILNTGFVITSDKVEQRITSAINVCAYGFILYVLTFYTI